TGNDNSKGNAGFFAALRMTGPNKAEREAAPKRGSLRRGCACLLVVGGVVEDSSDRNLSIGVRDDDRASVWPDWVGDHGIGVAVVGPSAEGDSLLGRRSQDDGGV